MSGLINEGSRYKIYEFIDSFERGEFKFLYLVAFVHFFK